jgi:hypothetical protein
VAESDVREVVLFDGKAAGGYGDAYRNPRRPNTIHETMHGVVASGGFAPYFVGTDVAWATGVGRDVRGVVEWEDSSGNPVILVALGQGDLASGALVQLIASAGTISEDEAFAGDDFSDVLPLALHSDGGATPLLYACFGTSGNIQYRNAAATWAATAGTPNQASGLFSENGNLWAVLTNGYQVRMWPAGTDPKSGTAAVAVDVGDASSTINGAGLLGQSVVVFVKPDGIYLYDRDLNRFENLWKGLDENAHPDTGKGTYTWGNNVVIPLGWGGAVLLTPDLQLIPCSPLPHEALPSHRTPGRSRILAMVSDAEYLYASVEPFTQRTTQPAMYVRTTTDDAAFNNRDSVSSDDDLATVFALVADLGALPGTLYIGSSSRLGGLWFDLSTPLLGTYSVQYWDGDSWETLTVDDYTQLASVAGGLSKTGAIVPTARIPTNWATTTVNSQSAYWLRIVVTLAAGGTANIREVRLLPDIAPLDGTNVSLSGYHDAGLRTEILRGYLEGGRMVWEPIISHAGHVGQALVLSRLKAAGGGRTLYALGPLAATRFPLGNRGNPAEEQYPSCVNGFASLLTLPYDDRIAEDKEAPTLLKQVRYVRVYGREFDEANDLVQAWASYDDEAYFPIDSARRLPARLQETIQNAGKGYEYSVRIGLEDGSRGERVPLITRVVAGVVVTEPGVGE